jgi:hypothetical protein
MNILSRWVRNLAVSGTSLWLAQDGACYAFLENHDSQSGSRNITAIPNTTVTSPSKRKRYCHPLRPCEPDIVSKAYANNPLKTPERLPKTSVGG